MKYTSLKMLTATAIFAVATTAYAEVRSVDEKSNVDYKSNGGYEANRHSEGVLSSGTKVKTDNSVDVDYDKNGKIDKTTTSEKVRDPEGLMNAKKDRSETNIKEKGNGGYVQTTTRTHKDANGTNVKLVTETDVSIDNAGNLTTDAVTKKTVDPEGLMNEKTTTTRVKIKNGTVIKNEKHTD